ncbi:MAG TPA: alkaline phosphatase family protein, partial [Candidatus Dormibacteraeota bacterium]|nr:alkaline phosphatase family protein [Candidatus Dormibacteraeota bacterium]
MRRFGYLLVTTLLLVACGNQQPAATSSPTATNGGSGLQKIKHIVVVMQENRSFDEYFGLYPGADGLPRQNGQFTVCMPDPANGGCVKPYHDPTDKNG